MLPARIGPEKVVLAMIISCRGKCQPHIATVRDELVIQYL
jgi:hypothetical protein